MKLKNGRYYLKTTHGYASHPLRLLNPHGVELVEGNWYLVREINGRDIAVGGQFTKQFTSDTEDAYYIPKKFSYDCNYTIENAMEIIPNG